MDTHTRHWAGINPRVNVSPEHFELLIYQMRVSRGEGYWILWVSRWTIVRNSAGDLYQLRPGASQID